VVSWLIMYFIVYKTTNTINNRYYIGSHKTSKLEDGYLGSGKVLKRALKKYGKSSFKREILFMAFDMESLKWAEEQLIITEKQDPLSYNQTSFAYGGSDGSNLFGKKVHSIEFKEKMKRHPHRFLKGRKATGNVFKKGCIPIISGKICINNGINQRWHEPHLLIPDGWIRGNLLKQGANGRFTRRAT